MRNKPVLLAVLAAAVFILGIGGGYFAGWYEHVRLPQASLLEAVKTQYGQTGEMVKQGKVVSAGPDSITMEEAGKTAALPVDSNSVFAVYNLGVKPSGVNCGADAYFKPGDQISAFVKNGRAVVLYRDARAGETQNQ